MPSVKIVNGPVTKELAVAAPLNVPVVPEMPLAVTVPLNVPVAPVILPLAVIEPAVPIPPEPILACWAFTVLEMLIEPFCCDDGDRMTALAPYADAWAKP